MSEWLACSAPNTYRVINRPIVVAVVVVAVVHEKSLYRFSQENQISTNNLNTKFENIFIYFLFHWKWSIAPGEMHASYHIDWLGNASSKLLKCNIDMANEAKYSHSCNMFLLLLLRFSPSSASSLYLFFSFSLGWVSVLVCVLHAVSVWNKDCHTRGRHILVIQQTFSKHAVEWIPRNENYQNQRENIFSHNHCESWRALSERTLEINLASRNILIRCFAFVRAYLIRPGRSVYVASYGNCWTPNVCVWLAKQENRREESEQRVVRTLPHWLYLRFYFIIKEYKTDDEQKEQK